MARCRALATKLTPITLLSDLTPISVNYTVATYFHLLPLSFSLILLRPSSPLTFFLRSFFPIIFLNSFSHLRPRKDLRYLARVAVMSATIIICAERSTLLNCATGENALIIRRKGGSLSILWNFANYMANRWFTCRAEVTSITTVSNLDHWWRVRHQNCSRAVELCIDVAFQCNWRRSCDWKQRHAIHLLLDTDNYGDTWYALQFPVERNLQELEIKSRAVMVERVQKPIRFPMMRAGERENEREEGGENNVHIDALAQKAHVRPSVSLGINKSHLLSFPSTHRFRNFETQRGRASPCSEFARFLVVFPVLQSRAPFLPASGWSPSLPLIRDSETLGLIKCKMLPANNA